ncbi:MAG TPA: hypothetical protein VLF41_00770 [Candidatus Nanoarchaeia archaeon]|nr:hypothetical protein [Candidatus Nanoarchaeia archaeon]
MNEEDIIKDPVRAGGLTNQREIQKKQEPVKPNQPTFGERLFGKPEDSGEKQKPANPII